MNINSLANSTENTYIYEQSDEDKAVSTEDITDERRWNFTEEISDDAWIGHHEILGDVMGALSAIFFTARVFVTNRGLNPFVVCFWVATSGVGVSIRTLID